MTPTPRVSVIIPAFNAEAFIGDTLDTVLGQTYGNLEVIVSDDGSTDGTRDRVRTFGSRVKWLSAPNSGSPAKPRNAGVRTASGSLVAFIDADDLMAPDRLAAQVQFFARHPHAGVVFSDYEEFGAHQVEEHGHFQTCPRLRALLEARPAGTDGLVLTSATATDLLLTENFGSSSPMVRRRVIDQAGGFDESAAPSEDFEFNFRVASVCAVGILPRIQWYKRQHPLNLSADVERVLRRKIDVRRRLLEAETVGRRRRKLKRMIAGWHADLAYFYTGRNNAAAIRHVLSGLRFSGSVRPRLVARLALDLLGRDTNNLRTG